MENNSSDTKSGGIEAKISTGWIRRFAGNIILYSVWQADKDNHPTKIQDPIASC